MITANGHRTEEKVERGNSVLKRLAVVLTSAFLTFALFSITLWDENAHAWPGKHSSCTGCHSNTDPDAAIYTAIDGVETTTVTVAAGGSFEVGLFRGC